MDGDTYKQWADHPLRNLMKRAAAGGHIHADELDDLRLPPRLKSATREALEQAPGLKPLQVDQLSVELFEALPEHHETRSEYEERRASLGDADALANIRAREEATSRMADSIFRNSGAHA